ncbi:hypothetical protein LG296_04785 [Ureibacillus chungkukjangi]|uniref:sugar phosphate nucleotidyltransferase n=1 Tax=Ureibacillus chungkukjangi TaxID=1202712 RepID=UPI00384C5776
MKIIITMAGNGSRFTKIGINKPKYKILARGKTLFEWSMLSLSDFFNVEFLFIIRLEHYDEEFLKNKCRLLGIKNYKFILINKVTDGQATTALYADNYITDNEECIIYNIDTYVKENLILKKDFNLGVVGYIPAIKAHGDKWSFVKIDNQFRVTKIAEKIPISNNATIGFYYFKEWNIFKDAYNLNKDKVKNKYNEIYIAPLYESLLEKGDKVITKIIPSNDVYILGTPEEVELFDKDFMDNNRG